MASKTSRTMIAALQVSLDGFTQGPDRGEADWVDSWADAIALIPEVDTFVHPILLGGGKALFAGVNKRRSLNLVRSESTESGRVILTYRT